MKLEVKRFYEGSDYTMGVLSIDGIFECFTLEDKVRRPFVKIPGQTAIPDGTYDVTIDMSNRFGRMMPHVLNVPSFEGIRIHAGNTSKDTEGCILLGQTSEKGYVGKSKLAYDAFYDKLQQGVKNGGKVSLFIH